MSQQVILTLIIISLNDQGVVFSTIFTCLFLISDYFNISSTKLMWHFMQIIISFLMFVGVLF